MVHGGLATQAKHLKSKPLVGILLRCCEDTDKNKSRGPTDETAGTFIRKIRRLVKRLSQKDIPEHKVQGDPWEQKNSLKNRSTQSVIQLRSPARRQEVHQLHSGKRFPGMENQFSNLESPAGETAQGDKKVSVHNRSMRTHVCIPASMLKLGVGTHTCSRSVWGNRGGKISEACWLLTQPESRKLQVGRETLSPAGDRESGKADAQCCPLASTCHTQEVQIVLPIVNIFNIVLQLKCRVYLKADRQKNRHTQR